MMKTQMAAALAFVVASATKEESNPLGKVLTLMDGLSAKVVADGEAEAKAYKEYFEWCDDAASSKNNDITSANSMIEKLTASINELSASIEVADTTISDLASAISTATADLKAATEIRDKEAADFAASEKELAEAVDTLSRAITIIEKEMAKNPAALAQVNNNQNLEQMLQSLSVVMDAAAFAATDKQRLVALVQATQASQDGDEDELLGAPAASTYKTQSGGILDVLEDMHEKADTQLAELRKAESTAKHNYAMLKQSLEDQLSADNKHMEEEKAGKASAEESKAVAEGDLSVTTEDLKASKVALETTNANCMQVAADHEATVAARAEELKVIAEARGILQKTAEGAVEQTYSLLQVALESRVDLARSEVLAAVKKLAKQQHSSALAQLASRISAVERFGASATGGADPFVKIKGLIQDMIAKLEAEAESEATEKAYCDEELSKTNAKKSELDSDIEALTTKIDQAAAASAGLKGEVKDLQDELATMAKEQSDNQKWITDKRAEYTTAKADLELGLGGVRQALDVLRSYYGAAAFLQQPAPPAQHEKSTGAADSIIGILEVCESDFATNLAKENTEMEDSQETYDTFLQEYKITKAKKEQDVKYKTQEFVGLDKSITELSSDRETENTELAAVTEYLKKLEDRCIAKPETYEERSKRRNAEIEGLKSALSILENEAAFVQRHGKRRGRHMRGALVAN